MDQPQKASDLLKRQRRRWRVSLFGERLHVITDDDPETGIRETTQAAGAIGIQVRESHEEPYSLEDVFIVVVEKARQQGKVPRED